MHSNYQKNAGAIIQNDFACVYAMALLSSKRVFMHLSSTAMIFNSVQPTQYMYVSHCTWVGWSVVGIFALDALGA